MLAAGQVEILPGSLASGWTAPSAPPANTAGVAEVWVTSFAESEAPALRPSPLLSSCLTPQPLWETLIFPPALHARVIPSFSPGFDQSYGTYWDLHPGSTARCPPSLAVHAPCGCHQHPQAASILSRVVSCYLLMGWFNRSCAVLPEAETLTLGRDPRLSLEFGCRTRDVIFLPTWALTGWLRSSRFYLQAPRWTDTLVSSRAWRGMLEKV